MKFFKTKNISILMVFVSLLLFVVPFFWFKYPEMDLGGDSSRLYFYDPLSWLKNIGLFSTNSLTGMGVDNPNYMMIPFLSFLIVLKMFLFNNPFLLNCFFSGILLSGSFIFSYLSISELIKEKNSDENNISSLIGALFFSLSPLIIYEWQKALYSFNQIFVYPLVFFLFLKYIKTGKNHFLAISAIVTFIFSVNFSYPTFPWLFAFFSFSFIFLFVYSIFLKKRNNFFKGTIIFGCLFIFVQFFHLLPQVINILDFTNPNSRAIFDSGLSSNRGLQYFLSVQPYVRLTYNFLNQPQYMLPTTRAMYDYGLKYRYIFYVYLSLVLFGGLIINKIGTPRQKIFFAVLLVFFLILLFFMTANINFFLLNLYKSMFRIPGFSMFRSFYTKFGMTYVFFYAILLCYCLNFVLVYLKGFFGKGFLVLLLFCLIIFNGWPLISGKIVNVNLSQSKNVKLPIEINETYAQTLSFIKNQAIDAKYFSLPLANEYYQIIKGKNNGAYFGPSITGILAGKNDFCGQESFGPFQEEIMMAMEEKNIQVVKSYLQILAIKYIFHNSDNYIYDNFGGYPYSEQFKKTFPNQNIISTFIKELGYTRKVYADGNYSIFFNDSNFLPHFYIPRKTISLNTDIGNLPEIFSKPDWNIRSAVILSQQNFGKRNVIGSEQLTSSPVVEYKKINPSKYRIVIHQARGILPLIFSEGYHDGWRLYFSKSSINQKNFLLQVLNLSNVTSVEKESDNQAEKQEIFDYISKGWISDLGKSQTLNFISKNFQDVVQNNNLKNGKIYETWFSEKNVKLLSADNHFLVNGYANLWAINSTEICYNSNLCLKNEDGSYEIEAIVEFFPQRFLFAGVLVSVIAFLGCLIILFFSFFNRKNINA